MVAINYGYDSTQYTSTHADYRNTPTDYTHASIDDVFYESEYVGIDTITIIDESIEKIEKSNKHILVIPVLIIEEISRLNELPRVVHLKRPPRCRSPPIHPYSHLTT